MLTIEQYNQLLIDAADSAKAPEALTKLRDEGAEIFTTLTSAATQATADAAKIKELQEVNMRMFLKNTTPVQPQEEEHELTDAEIDAKFREALLGKDYANGNDS